MQKIQKVRAQEMIISKFFTISIINKKSIMYEKNQTLKIFRFIIHGGTGLRSLYTSNVSAKMEKAVFFDFCCIS
jgi:hypothetical protein